MENTSFGAKGVGGGQKILALGHWRPKPGLIVGYRVSGSKLGWHLIKTGLVNTEKSFFRGKKLIFPQKY